MIYYRPSLKIHVDRFSDFIGILFLLYLTILPISKLFFHNCFRIIFIPRRKTLKETSTGVTHCSHSKSMLMYYILILCIMRAKSVELYYARVGMAAIHTYSIECSLTMWYFLAQFILYCWTNPIISNDMLWLPSYSLETHKYY